MGLNQQPQDYGPNAYQLSYIERYVECDLNILLYSAISYSYNVTPHCITTRLTSCIEHASYYFIKTENIALDEIGRIICPQLLASAHTYFYIKLLCMKDAMTCNIVTHYSAV